MPIGFYRDLVKELSRIGFKFQRQTKGSHEKWHNSDTGVSVNVPFNLNNRHTANAILKDAGSTMKF